MRKRSATNATTQRGLIKTTVQLEPEQYQRLVQLALISRRPLASVVRESVQVYLQSPPVRELIQAVA